MEAPVAEAPLIELPGEPVVADTCLMTWAENLASADLSGWLDSVQTWRVTHSQDAASCAPAALAA